MMRLTRFAGVVVLVALGAVAQAQNVKPEELARLVTPYMAEDSVGVGMMDVRQLEPAAFEEKLTGWMKLLNVAADDQKEAINRLRSEKSGPFAAKWRDQFLAAGGRHLLMVFGMSDIPDSPGYVIAPLEKGADGKAIAGLLFSGDPKGPTELTEHGPNTWPTRAVVLEGAVFLGDDEQLKSAKAAGQGPARAGLAEALATTGPNATARIIFLPTADMRNVFTKVYPRIPAPLDAPTTVISDGVTWAAAGFELSPKSALKVTIQSSNADAARALGALIDQAAKFASEDEHVKKTAGGRVAAALPRLVPKVEGDKLTLALDDEQFQKLVGDVVGPGMLAARQKATAMLTVNNMKQLLVGCFQYAEDNKGDWPDKIEAVTPQYVPADMLNNPRMKNKKPGFVYIKPGEAALNRPDQTIVLHEPMELPADEGKVAVGFADGHVELLPKEELQKRLK